MKSSRLLPLSAAGLFLALSISAARADAPEVWPRPQKMAFTNAAASLPASALPAATAKILPPFGAALAARQIAPTGRVEALSAIVCAGDAARFASLTQGLPAQPVEGAYFIQINATSLRVVAFDDAGAFYAAQTLAQCLDRNGRLPSGTISDWPDVPYRGTVEGFYGAPWKHEARLRQIAFYGAWKMNAYIYGPKDDPFHGFGNRWREPYPPEQAAQIRELAQAGRQNHVHFIWAVHPGNHIKWVDGDGDGVIDDFKACVSKLEKMYELGVRGFAVFFDDIGGEGARPERQVELLNYIHREFIQKKKDVAPFIFCPTQYSGTGDTPYIRTIGHGLHQDIAVMWTGPGICSDITAAPTQRIGELLQRPPFVWWNWPVVDYCRTSLLLGRAYGMDRANKGKYAGFVSNPMDKPEASKIALFGVANYTWNIDGFDSDATWRAGIRRLFPRCADAMQKFADHNSDQGPNAHGYRRLESEAFQPVVEAAQKQLAETGKLEPATAAALAREFAAITAAGNTLLTELPKTNPMLFHEIEFWVRSFVSLGEAGTSTIQLLAAPESPDQKVQLANRALRHFRSIDGFSAAQKERASADTTPGDRGWSRGCNTAARVVTPFVKQAFQKALAQNYAALTGSAAKAPVAAETYKILTNIPGLARLKPARDGIYVNFPRVMEVTSLPPGGYLGLLLPEGVPATYVHIKLQNPGLAAVGKIQVSKDGATWADFNARSSGEEMQNPIPVAQGVRAARYINTSASPIDIKINQFKLDVPADAFPNALAAITDGDPLSGYTLAFTAGQKINLPCPDSLRGARGIRLYTSGEFTTQMAGATVAITSLTNQTATLYELVPIR